MLKSLTKYLLIVVIVLGSPIFLAFLLDAKLFSFASGEVDSWIMFWGSYIGAIIGASAVYFVAQFQIKKQHEQQMTLLKLENKQQIKAIEIENKQSTKREMKKFYLTNKLEKIEDMQNTLEKLIAINIQLNNDLVTFVVVKEALDKGIKNNKNEDLNERIYLIRTNLKKHYFELNAALSRLSVLGDYVQGVSVEIFNLQEKFLELFDEVRNCFYSEELYKKYLTKPDSETFTAEMSEIITRKICYLSYDYLQKELRSTINEIEDYIK